MVTIKPFSLTNGPIIKTKITKFGDFENHSDLINGVRRVWLEGSGCIPRLVFGLHQSVEHCGVAGP